MMSDHLCIIMANVKPKIFIASFVDKLSSILFYYIKLKSRLSVRPSDRHADISAV